MGEIWTNEGQESIALDEINQQMTDLENNMVMFLTKADTDKSPAKAAAKVRNN